jgi:hypothetical protein
MSRRKRVPSSFFFFSYPSHSLCPSTGHTVPPKIDYFTGEALEYVMLSETSHLTSVVSMFRNINGGAASWETSCWTFLRENQESILKQMRETV